MPPTEECLFSGLFFPLLMITPFCLNLQMTSLIIKYGRIKNDFVRYLKNLSQRSGVYFMNRLQQRDQSEQIQKWEQQMKDSGFVDNESEILKFLQEIDLESSK